jgi:glycosyltransferase involved in cell wall biosynthesis
MVGAFAEVLKCSPEALLLIVGSALFPCNVPYEVSVRQKIEELGISANVLMLGNRDDVPLLLETMDLLVLPSRNEPFPMILLEAMSAATPTVAFAVDGVPELLADRRTAWLVRSGDAVQLARTILWAKKHPEQRRRLASAARVALRKQDTPEIYGKRLASILLKHAYPVQTSSSTAMVESHASQLGETA